MGPTNVALVKLYQTELALRESQGHLEAASKNVRIQERRVSDLTEKLRLAHHALQQLQAKGGNLDLDIKSRDARIEKLRTQQQQAKNAKEYQAFLVEINTEKADRNKVEDETLKVLEQVERIQGEAKTLVAQHDEEKKRLDQIKAQIGDKLAALQADIDRLRPARDQAYNALPPKARQAFERLSERHEGEAMGPLVKPDRRREEYVCGACQMSLVVDIYNRLHSRDELVACTSCGRLLFIPEDLPPDVAVHKAGASPATKPKSKREPRAGATKGVGAAINRQSSAEDVVNSVTIEEDAPAAESTAPAEETADTPPGA